MINIHNDIFYFLYFCCPPLPHKHTHTPLVCSHLTFPFPSFFYCFIILSLFSIRNSHLYSFIVFTRLLHFSFPLFFWDYFLCSPLLLGPDFFFSLLFSPLFLFCPFPLYVLPLWWLCFPLYTHTCTLPLFLSIPLTEIGRGVPIKARRPDVMRSHGISSPSAQQGPLLGDRWPRMYTHIQSGTSVSGTQSDWIQLVARQPCIPVWTPI